MVNSEVKRSETSVLLLLHFSVVFRLRNAAVGTVFYVASAMSTNCVENVKIMVAPSITFYPTKM